MSFPIYVNTVEPLLAHADVEYFHPFDLTILEGLGNHYFDESTQREKEATGVVGHIGPKTLKVSPMAPVKGRSGVHRFVGRWLNE